MCFDVIWCEEGKTKKKATVSLQKKTKYSKETFYYSPQVEEPLTSSMSLE